MMQGEDKLVWDNIVSNLEIEVHIYNDNLDFQVMNMDHIDIVISREWLWRLGPSLKQNY